MRGFRSRRGDPPCSAKALSRRKAIPLLSRLRKGIPQPNRAVEHRQLRRGIRVFAEIARAQELQCRPRRAFLRVRLNHAAHHRQAMLIQLLQEVIIRAGQIRVRFLCLFGFFRIHRILGGS